jgi:hypothetical protein
MVLNATFNNISAISWWSVLLMEETEKTTDLQQPIDKLYHIILCLYQLYHAEYHLLTSILSIKFVTHIKILKIPR